MFDRKTSLLASCAAIGLAVAAYTRAEPDESFPADDLQARVESVNEGELKILPIPPAAPKHHHRNHIRITERSLSDGWVMIEQCHEHLDPVAALQIVYRPQYTRALRILSSRGIAQARVEENSIQLEDIGPGGELCVSLRSKALEFESQSRLSLRTGPYMRRFLDGYYPLRVSLEVSFPAHRLRFLKATPGEQRGVRFRALPGRLELDLWFEGILNSRFEFCRSEAGVCGTPAAGPGKDP